MLPVMQNLGAFTTWEKYSNFGQQVSKPGSNFNMLATEYLDMKFVQNIWIAKYHNSNHYDQFLDSKIAEYLYSKVT
jgi:hypothetical protein